ncbi:uncharacterized protein BO97DRAFT_383985 [Aspergillus homomorphus CBS 101889]|uniref:MARVEL domain-containing protein n=1 Tax=Aspergillus homomorphus (strain CBS 101889) TaxID=1450537 RepID=A0A395I7C8_ASPHC|nr:hypothetical protein BO97DRAFT_383985 [Aspergillus homomorphus CBS 101889]RAL16031.1 hypothetical protein BO97DRAFT_383985 [Aspergillus homomorphus CBS 101889]
MIGSLFFILNRLLELILLIPIIGMMAYFVNGYLNANMITPAYILVIFIVSVIAAFWCIDTMIRISTTRRSALFVAFVDLLFFGAFIAGVYELRFITNADCAHWNGGSVYISLGPFGYYGYSSDNPLSFHINKTCAMLKACFALGIIEVVLFFWTAILAVMIYRRPDVVVKETTVRRRSHSSRRGHRRHSSSRSRHQYAV